MREGCAEAKSDLIKDAASLANIRDLKEAFDLSGPGYPPARTLD